MNPTRRAARWGAAGLGLLLVVGALVAALFPLWWGHRAAVTSQALLRQAGVTSRAASGSGKACLAAAPSAGVATSGVLSIPSLGVTAPVLNGLGDDQLNIAVGHDPTSPWPSSVGTSILEAHDVSFFSRLSDLQPGDTVTWQAGCARSTFVVNGAAVMQPGQAITPPAGGVGVALITCWPTDALWWTSQRYVVDASLVSTSLDPSPAAWPSSDGGQLRVPAATSLAAGGLGLTTNSVALGTLTLTGTPGSAWSSSPAPLNVVRAALEEYVAARRSVQAHNPDWWASIATPGVAMPGGWHEPSPLNVTVSVGGSAVHSVLLRSGPTTLELGVSGSTLHVVAVSM